MLGAVDDGADGLVVLAKDGLVAGCEVDSGGSLCQTLG